MEGQLLSLEHFQCLIQIDAIATVAIAAKAVPHMLQPVGRQSWMRLQVAEIVDTLAAGGILFTIDSGHHKSIAVQRVAAIRRRGG